MAGELTDDSVKVFLEVRTVSGGFNSVPARYVEGETVIPINQAVRLELLEDRTGDTALNGSEDWMVD